MEITEGIYVSSHLYNIGSLIKSVPQKETMKKLCCEARLADKT